MVKISKKQIVEINRLRGLFPKSIRVRVERSADGGFCAEVKTFPGCVTEANTFSELIEMVNDAVRTYFEVPERLVSYMPIYPLRAIPMSLRA
ncbi:MAG: type II toxin-antitoxin system HicB family antitoxin [Patescibacteria group bacterium]|nr:type II toxin-antitoxin system HicB family antitoxin [Patescibacteria group bacterium]